MKVFLSYAHQDASIATQVRELLEASGLAVFDAQVDVLPGDNWASAIANALDESNAMVVLLTKEALDSPYVKHELQYALRKPEFEGRLVLLVIGSDEEVPAERLPGILDRIGWVRWQPNDAEPLRAVAKSLIEAA